MKDKSILSTHSSLESLKDEVLKQYECLLQSLEYARNNLNNDDSIGLNLRVGAIISLTSELEKFISNSLKYMYIEINDGKHSNNELKTNIVMLSLVSHADKLASKNKRDWATIYEFIMDIESSKMYSYNPPNGPVGTIPPLSGSNVGPKEIKLVYDCLQIKDPPFPEHIKIPSKIEKIYVDNHTREKSLISTYEDIIVNNNYITSILSRVLKSRVELAHGYHDIQNYFKDDIYGFDEILKYIYVYIEQIKYMYNSFYRFVEDKVYLRSNSAQK